MAAQDTIELVRDGEIATLRINRPERKNALSYSMLDRMAALVRELKTDRGVRVVLFTAAGDTFCAGTDLQELSGRTFASDEERPETKAVVLSHGLWQRRFGGDRSLIGNSIAMNGEKYTVLGVMPQGFSYPDRQIELWLPLGLSPQLLSRRNSHFLKAIGRLKPGRDVPQAQSDMSAVARQLAGEFPATNARVGITVVSGLAASQAG